MYIILRIQFIRPENGYFGRLIFLLRAKIPKSVFIRKFLVHFKEGSGNVAFVTGKSLFDQLEIKDNRFQICKDITILCIQSHLYTIEYA